MAERARPVEFCHTLSRTLSKRVQTGPAAPTRLAIMRTPTLVLAGLLLLLASGRADDKHGETESGAEKSPRDAREEVEEVPKKEKGSEIREDNNVMVLHGNNFARALNQTAFLLVEFCE